MTEDRSKAGPSTAGKSSLKTEEVLSFKALGRPIGLDTVQNEFRLMQEHLGTKVLTSEIARRVCEKSGSHLLKMVSPRTEGEHACLYIEPRSGNRHPKILPSTNAPDIPFCKILYRPLEILGHPSRSVVDDILNPDDASQKVLEAFAVVFGQDVLDAMRDALLNRSKRVMKLAAGEFPIIFVPRPGGGDLQITPVAPAPAFMGLKRAISPFFEKQKSDGPRIARGKFHKQSVSSKPQNISGAIGGPRTRFEATMPPALKQADAEMYSYVRGGKFPRWRDPGIDALILRYHDMLEGDATYNDRNTRAALDRMADGLIKEARAFIDEMTAEARHAAATAEVDPATLGAPPNAAAVLLRRFWLNDTVQKARKALSSAHFEHRASRAVKSLEASST